MNRRSFIRNSALVLPGTLLGRGPVERTGSPNLKLSLAAYSFRNQFKWFKNRRNKNGGEMTLHHFVDYCANQRIPAAEITTYFFARIVVYKKIFWDLGSGFIVVQYIASQNP